MSRTKLSTFVAVSVLCSMLLNPVVADRPILLVTPKGVWQANVVNGVPATFIAQDIDVIVQGFGTNDPKPPDDPTPPPANANVLAVQKLTKATLQTKVEATAVAAVIDALVKYGLSGVNFKEALILSMPIADTSLKANGRLVKWTDEAVKITLNPAELKEGVTSAFDVSKATLDLIYDTATTGADAAITGEALDWVMIIELIKLILQMLSKLPF